MSWAMVAVGLSGEVSWSMSWAVRWSKRWVEQWDELAAVVRGNFSHQGNLHHKDGHKFKLLWRTWSRRHTFTHFRFLRTLLVTFQPRIILRTLKAGFRHMRRTLKLIKTDNSAILPVCKTYTSRKGASFVGVIHRKSAIDWQSFVTTICLFLLQPG